MKHKNILVIGILLVSVILTAGCIQGIFDFFTPKVSAAQLADKFAEIDAEVEVSSKTIAELAEFDEADLTKKPYEIAKEMIPDAKAQETSKTGESALAVSEDKAVLVIEFDDEFEAGNYMLAVQSTLLQQGYVFTERLKYGDLSNSFEKIDDDGETVVDNVTIAQKENIVVMYKENPEE